MESEITILVVNMLLVIGYGITFFWQRGLIKTMNNKLEILERFQNIFKLDEVEKYVSIIQKNHDIEKEQIRTERISDARRASINDAVSKLPKYTEQQLEELIEFSFTVLYQLDPSTRELFIGRLPVTEPLLRGLFNNEKLKSRSL